MTMEPISFGNDPYIERLAGRVGLDIARIIFLELQNRYSECNSKKHLRPNESENMCAHCFRTLELKWPHFKSDEDLQEQNDFYAGLVQIERMRAFKYIS